MRRRDQIVDAPVDHGRRQRLAIDAVKDGGVALARNQRHHYPRPRMLHKTYQSIALP